jgi:small subunit ribosomal protein S18
MKQCVFCSQNVKQIQYQDVETLRRFISSQAKIVDPRHTGVCAKHQRMLSRAIKQARVAGLLPFVRK